MAKPLKASTKTTHRAIFLRKKLCFTPKTAKNPFKMPPTVDYRGIFDQKKYAVKEPDPETGLYYYGARYLDPKTSRWLSGDPALGDYLPVAPLGDEEKKRNSNLPGQGGVFNYVNLHVYHYAGNNPVKYVDPDGETPIHGTLNNAINMDFGRDYMELAQANFKEGEYGWAAMMVVDAFSEAAYDVLGLAGGATIARSIGNIVGKIAATLATPTVALPLGSEIAKRFSDILTKSQIKVVKTIAEISHNWNVRNTLSGNNLNSGHIEKIKYGIRGLQNSITSIERSLSNPNLSKEARNILLTARVEATKMIQKATELFKNAGIE